ncbi:MAG: calcium/sodium antiporter [Clostridia bacterium]|nr:calcium/sodium antiporter [Clostridia bacterium]
MWQVILIILMLIVGLILIIKGGDYFVDGASWLAEVSGIPKFIVGATIVSIATTLPEIVVSLISAKSEPDMAIGTAVGSVVFNSGVIMAIALICAPFVIKRKDYAFKGILLTVVMALLTAFCYMGLNSTPITFETTATFGYVGAVVLLILFIVFIVENVLSAKKNASLDKGEEKIVATKQAVILNLVKLIVGAGGIAGGAILLKGNAVELAELAGISQAVIGVTILAIGTSLPELVTMIIAVKKGESSLSIGNIIGANTIDLAIILPLSAFIAGGSGLFVSNIHLLITMPVTLLVIAIGIIPTLIFKKFARWQGFTMFAIYLAYFIANILLVVL